MAYTDHIFNGAMVPEAAAVLDADALTATGVHGEWLALRRVSIKRIMASVEVAVVGPTTAPVVTFKRRPTRGSASGEVTIGTLTIPDGTAIGKLVIKDVTPVLLNAGEALAIEVTTAATGGSPAGNANYGFEADQCQNEDSEESNILVSA